MVDGGYICNTCSEFMTEEEWAKESMGQCKNCWEINPEPIPISFDFEAVKRIVQEEEDCEN